MSRKTRFRKSLFAAVGDDIRMPYSRTRVSRHRVSERTVKARRDIFNRFVETVYAAGYKPEHIANTKAKHLEAVLKEWERRNLSLKTAENYVTPLRLVFEKLNKGELVRMLTDWRARLKAAEDAAIEEALASGAPLPGSQVRTPDDNELPVLVRKIAEEDSLVALQLCLMRAFGLRVREAHRLRPALDWRDDELLIHRGSKGGRPRSLALTQIIKDDPEVEALLAHAREVAEAQGGSMMPDTYTETQWRNHYYWTLRKCGVTRKALGITSHRLRHAMAQAQYELETGEPAPVKSAGLSSRDGKAGMAVLKGRQTIADLLGHGRADITRFYLDHMAGKRALRHTRMRIQRGLRALAARGARESEAATHGA